MHITIQLHKLTPVTYFLVGQLLGFIPYAFLNSRVFTIYKVDISFFYFWLSMYSLILFYVVNKFLQKCKIRKVVNLRHLHSKRYTMLISVMVLIAIFLQVYVYRAIPLISILTSPTNIENINLKVSDIPALLGVALLLNQLTIFYFILTYKNRIPKTLFLLSIFSVIMNAKRQLFVVMILAIVSRRSWRLSSVFLITIFVFFIFSFIGTFRGSRNLLEPVLFYLSYSVINFSYAVEGLENHFTGFYGFLSAFEFSIPTVLRGIETQQTAFSMAETTAGLSLVGGVYLKSGILGLTAVITCIASFTSYLWRQGQNNEYFRVIYVYSIWPLISSNTYNLFHNVSFYILPIFIFTIVVLNSTNNKRYDINS